MRKLYPDVSQLIKENSQSEVEKKELDQVISAFSTIPLAQASTEFQQRLRTNLLEQAYREKPGRVITFLRKIKPHYLSIGAVATIFLAITAVAGPYYLELGKVGEIAKSQSSHPKEDADKILIPQEEPLAIKNKELNSDAILQDSTAKGTVPEAVMPQVADKKAIGTEEPLKLEQANQGLDVPQNEALPQGKVIGPRSSFSRTGLVADAVPGDLSKLPPVSEAQAVRKAELNPAIEIKYELKAPFPIASKELLVYQPSSAPFSIEEMEVLAARLKVSLPVIDEGEQYKVGNEQAILEVSKSEGRFIYHNFNSEKVKGKISEADVLALANKFISEKGFLLPEYDVEVLDFSEKQLYQIRYIPLILGIQSPGQAVFIDVRYNGSISTLSYLRYTLKAANKYPIVSPSEAWEQLKTEPIYGSAPNTVLKIHSFKLVYHNFVQPEQKVNQTYLQPAYFFSGVDNWGHSFKKFLPAVKSEYYQQD